MRSVNWQTTISKHADRAVRLQPASSIRKMMCMWLLVRGRDPQQPHSRRAVPRTAQRVSQDSTTYCPSAYSAEIAPFNAWRAHPILVRSISTCNPRPCSWPLRTIQKILQVFILHSPGREVDKLPNYPPRRNPSKQYVRLHFVFRTRRCGPADTRGDLHLTKLCLETQAASGMSCSCTSHTELACSSGYRYPNCARILP